MIPAILLLDKSEVGLSSRMLGCIHVNHGQKKRSLPLTSVQIAARVADRLAHVTVTETFMNPFSDHLEAVYIFPLAGGSAVSSFKMKVGERTIVGKVDERQAARDQYVEALQEGKRAALMEQERDDVFTVQVGNLPPGEEVQVEITYSEKLAYFDNGTTEIRLPLVVAPRYIPGNVVSRPNLGDGVELDTDIVPDASRISPPRLAPGVDPKTALSLSVELAGEQMIEDLSCSQHATRVGTSKDGFKISLAREDELLDRDFVLRWRVATDSVQSNLLLYRNPVDKSQCYGMISILPPRLDEVASMPRDVIFVVDRSGSMSGVKMVSAARACSILINTLGPKDRFAVQAFDDMIEWMNQHSGQRFVCADEGGKQLGERYLRTIGARGGTEMHGAMQDAIVNMRARSDASMRLPVIVVLTDGEVGNESPILKHIQSELGDTRVFTVGVDTAVNDGFLNRLAALGGGTSTFVQPGAQLEDALSSIGREIGTPVVTNLTLEDINCDLDKTSIAPSKIPDLFEGRASSAFFRLSARKLKDLKSGRIRIKGRRANGERFSQEVQAKVVDLPALSQLWAKSYIVDLEDSYRVSNASTQIALHKQIVDVAIAHSILTKFTAFVVVDHAEIVNAGGDVRTLVQPVQMPAQWDEQIAPGQLRCRIAKASNQNSAGSWGAPLLQRPGLGNALRAGTASKDDDDAWGSTGSWGGGGGSWGAAASGPPAGGYPSPAQPQCPPASPAVASATRPGSVSAALLCTGARPSVICCRLILGRTCR
jgi:Ca-activated chloride channel homolog